MAKPTTSTPDGKAVDSSGSSRPPARQRTATGTGRAGSATATSGRPAAGSLTSFFQESRAELAKVTWPTRQEAMNLTIAVIGMTIAIAVFLGLIDAALDKAVQLYIG